MQVGEKFFAKVGNLKYLWPLEWKKWDENINYTVSDDGKQSTG